VLIDSHAHLAGDRFTVDRGEMLQRAWDAGVSHVVVIGDTSDDAHALSLSDPARLSFTAGVHPHEAHTFDAARDMARIRALIAQGARAIGECGLDYFYDHSPRDAQLAAFEAQLQLAVETRLPVVVHTREAEADTIRCMRAAAARGVRGVLHCFTGSPDLARAALDVGWYISISGIATFRTWERDDVVAMVPDHLLLVETDAPYLAPVPFRGKRNESAFLPATVAHLARIRHTTPAILGAQTAANAIRLFGLPVSLPAL
jgi:TatD DNase family protein